MSNQLHAVIETAVCLDIETLLFTVIGNVKNLLSVIGISSALVNFQLYAEKTLTSAIKDGARLIRISFFTEKDDIRNSGYISQ